MGGRGGVSRGKLSLLSEEQERRGRTCLGRVRRAFFQSICCASRPAVHKGTRPIKKLGPGSGDELLDCEADDEDAES